MQANQLFNPQEVKLERPTLSNFNSSEAKKACLLFKSQGSASDPKLNKEYVNVYDQTTSIYLIKGINNWTALSVYNIEKKREKITKIRTPELLYGTTCIDTLPNDDLFCFGKDRPISGITLTISADFHFKILPSGTPCRFSSAIYFKGSVYCFGGEDRKYINLSLSKRFDIDAKRWIQLTSMPQADHMCQSAAFNGNILIAGFENMNIWIYSIDTNSFSSIPYRFSEKNRKILVNSPERLYLIECKRKGLFYESEIGDEYSWKQIGRSIIEVSSQVYYCSYKGWIYISAQYYHGQVFLRKYFKFNLKEKKIIQFGF